MEGILFVCMDVGVAAASVVFAMEGMMFVCIDVEVAAAYVVFVMEGIMFVCMDVGIAAGAHPSISHRHAPHDDSIPHGSKSGLRPLKKSGCRR